MKTVCLWLCEDWVFKLFKCPTGHKGSCQDRVTHPPSVYNHSKIWPHLFIIWYVINYKEDPFDIMEKPSSSYHQKMTFQRMNEMKKPFSGRWCVANANHLCVFKKMSEGVFNFAVPLCVFSNGLQFMEITGFWDKVQTWWTEEESVSWSWVDFVLESFLLEFVGIDGDGVVLYGWPSSMLQYLRWSGCQGAYVLYVCLVGGEMTALHCVLRRLYDGKHEW